MWGYLLLSLILGGLGGLTSILSRYRAQPGLVLRGWPAWVYILLHALVSSLVFYGLRLLNLSLGVPEQAIPLAQSLAAGFGGLAVLRFSFYTLRLDGETLSIGPATLVESLLQVIDREVDRAQAEARVQALAQIMEKVSFTKAYEPLPSLCFALVQTLPQDVQQEFGEAMRILAQSHMSDRAKSLIMGTQLANLVGEEVLQSAIAALGEDIAP